jgi:hypothetical protein
MSTDTDPNDSDHLPPLLRQMEQFADVRQNAEEIHEYVGEIKQDLHTMQWMAAGGLGTAHRESTIDKIDAQIRNLQTLRDRVDELDDPRELGEQARALQPPTETEGDHGN